jgi:1-deoxy-D-xylulose-5-phosphate synthase
MVERTTLQEERQLERLIDKVNSPADVRGMTIEELEKLAEEIRQEIIKVVSVNGGHLASNLGAVELTLALHKVFDTPRDKIVWDVGHQAYAHKLITGRRERFSTLRQYRGLSGFPSRAESPYDCFGVGHSSTSISAALGMAFARDLRGEDYKTIAFIGDGSMTAGMAFEALNHAGHAGVDIIVVLNDNEMAISPSVGALSAYLSRIITATVYNRAKTDIELILKRIPAVGTTVFKAARRLEETIKNLVTPGALFEELGFKYVGPLDGHNLSVLLPTLENIRHLKGPILLHAITKKGSGYEPAEKDPAGFHGARPFDVKTGNAKGTNALQKKAGPNSATSKTYTDIFAETTISLAERDERIVAITAAMAPGTGLDKFQKVFPERFFDVGIAEQHAVTLAAGLAVQGMLPVVAIYSTFLQRGYDQIVHDICIQNLPVLFAVDRAGLVGRDGPTHHGLFDIAYLRAIPNMTVAAPRDEEQFRLMLSWAASDDGVARGPIAVRYPRDAAQVAIGGPQLPMRRGAGQLLKEGRDAAIVALGSMVGPSLEAARILEREGMDVAVVDARFAKPLDTSLLKELLTNVRAVLTVEEHVLDGGFGSAVIEFAEAEGLLQKVAVRRVGLPSVFMEHGSRSRLLDLCGHNAATIARQMSSLIRQPAETRRD